MYVYEYVKYAHVCAHTHAQSSQFALSLNFPVMEGTDLGEKNENYKTFSSP